MRKDLVTFLHQRGRHYLDKGELVSFKDIQGEALAAGFQCADDKHKYHQLFRGVYLNVFLGGGGGSVTFDDVKNNAMSSEAYFRYMDYIEYKQALKSSRQAQRIAIWALAVAILTGLAQVLVGLMQIGS